LAEEHGLVVDSVLMLLVECWISKAAEGIKRIRRNNYDIGEHSLALTRRKMFQLAPTTRSFSTNNSRQIFRGVTQTGSKVFYQVLQEGQELCPLQSTAPKSYCAARTRGSI
jgi:hypothetical protein